MYYVIALADKRNFIKSFLFQASDIEYSCIGESICMGDHKPIFLSFETPMKSLLGNAAE